MEINQAGLELVKKAENDNDPKSGYRCVGGIVSYVPYIDEVGVCTIGIGSIMYENGTKVSMNDPEISEPRAFGLLQWELKSKAATIEAWANNHGIVLNENQFSALNSLAYNLGAGVITDTGRSMNAALLSKDPDQIKTAFMMYVKGYTSVFGIRVGKTLPGLVTRRQAEINLYFS